MPSLIISDVTVRLFTMYVVYTCSVLYMLLGGVALQ